MKYYRLKNICLCSAAACLAACTPVALEEIASVPSASASSPQSQYAGRWYGLVQQREGRFSRYFPVDIEILEREGRWHLIDHGRGSSDKPVVVQFSDDRAIAAFPSTPAGAPAITLTPAGNGALAYTIDNAGPLALSRFSATLSRDPALTAAFRAPRIDASGSRVEDYSYRAPVSREDGFPTAAASDLGVREAPLAQMVRTVLQESGDLDEPQIDSILILREGKLILEEYFWGQNENNPHEISSCTKSLTSMITGAAWDRGLVDLDKPAADYFPNYSDSLWAKENYPITLRHILSMNSGTEWDDWKSNGAPSMLLLASDDIADYMLNKSLVAEPGTRYNYDNGLPSLQGLLIERAVQEPFEAFADRTILKPLGITNYDWVETRDNDRPLAAGGFLMRPIDAAKLGQVMLDQGMWQGNRILSSEWVRISTENHSAAEDYPYGFYWHLTNIEKRHVAKVDGYSAMGQGGQFIMVMPSQKTVIVINSSSWRTAAFSQEKGTPLDLISEYVVPALLDEREPASSHAE